MTQTEDAKSEDLPDEDEVLKTEPVDDTAPPEEAKSEDTSIDAEKIETESAEGAEPAPAPPESEEEKSTEAPPEPEPPSAPEPVVDPCLSEYVTRLETSIQLWEEAYREAQNATLEAHRWRNTLEQRTSFKIYRRLMRAIGRAVEP